MTGIPVAKRDETTRFFSKVDASGICWEWTAALAFGYGRFRVADKIVQAHRWTWEHLVGEIPEGLDLDHLCRNRKCVNPDHLEPVSRQVNLARGASATKTHCRRGHTLTSDNIYVNQGKRYCIECFRVRRAKYRAK